MRRRELRWAALLLALPLFLLALDHAFPPDLRRAGLLSPELDGAGGRVLNLRPAADGTFRLAAGPDGVGADIVPLLLAREDRRFWQMPGVDPLALLRASGQVLRYGRIVSGGSTVAMQVARLLEPHPRNALGKLHDIVRGLQLQAHLGRAELLRLYLTLAPMGGNVEGVRAASLLYFGREPAALTRSQAALLVSLPQSPARRRPDRHEDAAWAGAPACWRQQAMQSRWRAPRSDGRFPPWRGTCRHATADALRRRSTLTSNPAWKPWRTARPAGSGRRLILPRWWSATVTGPCWPISAGPASSGRTGWWTWCGRRARRVRR